MPDDALDVRPAPAGPAPLDHAQTLLDQDARLGALVREADLDADIPTCPGWTLAKLAAHVGRGHRWAATMIRDRATEVLDPRRVADGKAPADPGELAGWLAAGAQAVLDAVEQTGPDVPIWTFTGPKPAAWWIRRRLHEETAHRADALLALGRPLDLDALLGADGLSEWLDLLTAPRPKNPGPFLPEGSTLHLHATDGELGAAGEWTIQQAGEVIAWEHGHAKGTVAVRGPAVSLFLLLLGRVPADAPQLTVFGPAGLLTDWLAKTHF